MIKFAPMWLLGKLSTAPHDELVTIETMLWGVWFARNQKLWEPKRFPQLDAIGVQEAALWLLSTSVHNVTIESDSLLTVQALSKNTPNNLELGHVLYSCREILHATNDFVIAYIRKQANKASSQVFLKF